MILPEIPRIENTSLRISRINVNLSRYILLRDMVKDATHHPDYKVTSTII